MKKSPSLFPIAVLMAAIIAIGAYMFYGDTFQKKSSSLDPTIFYLEYENQFGKIEKYVLPGPASGSLDGNIYVSYKDDGVLGIGKDGSGNLLEFRDTIDIAENLSDIIPYDDWNILDSASPMIRKFYKVFRLIEKPEDTSYLFADRESYLSGSSDDISQLVDLFQGKGNPDFIQCIASPYSDISPTTSLTGNSQKICAQPVPENLVFGQHERDLRYWRYRYSLFYKAFTSGDSGVCEGLLKTSFPEDNEFDPVMSQFQNYLLCETISSKAPINEASTKSDAIRIMAFRKGEIEISGKCQLYDNPEIRKRCNFLSPLMSK